MGQLEEGNAGLLAAEVLQEDGRHEKKMISIHCFMRVRFDAKNLFYFITYSLRDLACMQA